jgi:hypothetical protein
VRFDFHILKVSELKWSKNFEHVETIPYSLSFSTRCQVSRLFASGVCKYLGL